MKILDSYTHNNREYDLIKQTDTTKCFMNEALGLVIITNNDFDILYEFELEKNEYGSFIILV